MSTDDLFLTPVSFATVLSTITELSDPDMEALYLDKSGEENSAGYFSSQSSCSGKSKKSGSQQSETENLVPLEEAYEEMCQESETYGINFGK